MRKLLKQSSRNANIYSAKPTFTALRLHFFISVPCQHLFYFVAPAVIALG
jgi:hypothetical protein